MMAEEAFPADDETAVVVGVAMVLTDVIVSVLHGHLSRRPSRDDGRSWTKTV